MNEPPLGLRFRTPWAAWLASAFVFVVLAATTSRSIGLFDEGELVVAAYELGLGHPTGQPLHTLLGFVFTHLPAVSPAHGLALLSALAAALAVLPAVALAERFLPEGSRRFVAEIVVASIALHGLVWEPSTRIEVYPLATLFGLLAAAYASADSMRPMRVGVCLGLAASANPVIAIIAAIVCVILARRSDERVTKSVARAALGLAVGLAPYLHLAVAAMRNRAFVWGGLDSGEEWLHYLSGKDYGGNLGASLSTRFDHAREFVGYLVGERAAAALLASAVLGIAALAIRSRRAVAASVVAFFLPLAFVSSNVIFAVDVPDYLGYLGFGLLFLAVPIAAALDAALERSRVGFVLGVAIVGAALLSSPPLFERTRASDDVTARLAHIVLDEAPRGAIVVLDSDHLVAPLLYLQRVERVRPDVVVVIRGLMSSSWYLRLLRAQHAGLHDYPVRGPNGREGRIRRLIDANASRAIRVEHLGLATALGIVACPGGLTFATGADCDRPDGRIDLGPLVRTFARAHRLPGGSIDASMVVPIVGLRLALDLERFGANRAAYTVLVASLPDRYRGTFLPPPSTIADARPLGTGDPVFARRRALGDPAQNAFVVARMLADAGQIDPAVAITRIAAADGLPEAIDLLSRAREER